MPLIEVARTKTKPEALEALETWKAKHPDVVAQLHPADVLVDGMRGSSSLWYRVRVNLQHVPEAERPEQGELIADYDPWAGKEWPGRPVRDMTQEIRRRRTRHPGVHNSGARTGRSPTIRAAESRALRSAAAERRTLLRYARATASARSASTLSTSP